MKLSKYVKLVKGGGYCMVAHVEDSGIWLGTRSAIFRATELPDMVGEEQVRTVLDMPEKAWEKVHFDERWEGTVKSIFGMNLSDYADGEQDTEKLKVMAAPDGLWCDCRRSMDDGELIFYREAMLSPLAEQIKESDYIRYTVRKMESGQRYLVVHDGFEVLAAIMPVRIVTESIWQTCRSFRRYAPSSFTASGRGVSLRPRRPRSRTRSRSGWRMHRKMKTETVEARAVKIAAKIMQADGLCRYDDVDKCRRVYATTEICERCIHSWLLTKAKVELIREGKMKHEC